MSFFKAYKEEIEKKSSKSNKRDTSIDIARIEEVKKRLSILSEPQPDLKIKNESTQYLIEIPGNSLGEKGEPPDLNQTLTTDKPDLNQTLTTDKPDLNQTLTTDKPDLNQILTTDKPDLNQILTTDKPDTINKPDQNQELTIAKPGLNHILTKSILQSEKIDSIVWRISDLQCILLGTLLCEKNNIIKRKAIIVQTGLKESFIKFNLLENSKNGKTLKSYGFITKTKNIGGTRGTQCFFNNDLCNEFLNTRWNEIIKKYGNPPSIIDRESDINVNHTLATHKPHLNHILATHKPDDLNQISTRSKPSSPISSSSFLYKNTTTTELPNDDQTAVQKLLDHPELEFWREQGTIAKQILNGVQTTGTTLDNFIQSMKHYAHEKPASEKAPMAHMIGGIKRNGIWAKKPDYKSHEEKQAEIQAQIITERAQELQRLKEIREKAAKIERDLEFEKFMADRDAGFYQEIFQSLTDFEKKRVALGKDDAMRRAWEKKLEL